MVSPLLKAALIAYMHVTALAFGLDPYKVQAVAIVESRAASGGELEIRVGRLGRSSLYGPMG
jgi:hypothetical protein